MCSNFSSLPNSRDYVLGEGSVSFALLFAKKQLTDPLGCSALTESIYGETLFGSCALLAWLSRVLSSLEEPSKLESPSPKLQAPSLVATKRKHGEKTNCHQLSPAQNARVQTTHRRPLANVTLSKVSLLPWSGSSPSFTTFTSSPWSLIFGPPPKPVDPTNSLPPSSTKIVPMNCTSTKTGEREG